MSYLKDTIQFRVNKSNTNELCDLLEILCVLSLYKKINHDEIADYIYDEIKIEEDLESEGRDKIVTLVKEIFNKIHIRSLIYGRKYPFNVNVRTNSIELKNGYKNNNNIIGYILLLFSSNMYLLSKPGINNIGHYFEGFCKYGFENLIPKSVKYYFFGKGAQIKPAFPSSSHKLKNKIEKLAELIYTEPTSTFKKDPPLDNNTGDGGIDWVGWQTFPDDENRFVVYTGQCACGEDWIDKQDEAGDENLMQYLQLNTHPLITFHFIPKHVRNDDNKFINSTKIRRVTLVDRYRLLSMYNVKSISEAKKHYKIFLNEIFNRNLSFHD
jgi:hypothetical protein